MINGLGAPFTAQHSPKHFLSDQCPDQFLHEHLMALQLCGEQPQNLLAHTSYFTSPPSCMIRQQLAHPWTGLASQGGLHSPTPISTGPGDFRPAPIRLYWQPQQKSISGSSSTHSNQVPNLNQYQNQTPQGFVCGYSPELKSGPRVPSVPAQLPPMLQASDSYRSMGKPEPWMNHVFGGDTDTSPPSSDWDTDLSASGFLRSLADYDCSSAEMGTDQSRTGEISPRELAQSLSVAFPCSEPTEGSGRSQRTFACQWLDGALCNSHVMLERRRIVEHLQRVHGIKPGEEKARERCLWEKCGTTLNKESLPRHILTVHLKEGARCHDCGVVYAREDSLKRHLKGGLHNAPPEKHGTQSP